MMKDVMAIIRINMINQTKRALSDAGISSFTVTGRVLGRGKGKVDFRIINGTREGYEEAIAQLGEGPKLVPKRLLSIVVPENLVPKVVDTLIKTNQTGQAGDGKIFVMPIEDTVRVRTGEVGELVLDA